jgi:enoyl-CoA hydratase/carnithine racemase
MPNFRTIVVSDEGPVRVVTLNEPQRRNALSLETIRSLDEALEEAGADAGVHVIVLRGEGPAFSSGHDLRELRSGDDALHRDVFDACVRLMRRFVEIPQPLIAEVDGVATAAGCQIVAACDLAVASDRSTFATPGVRIGLFCSTPMVALSRAIGRKRALQMLLTGDPIDAPTALDWGLVNIVVPPERTHDETIALAQHIARSSATVLAIGKRAFYAQVDRDMDDAYAYTKEVMIRNASEADACEGIDAFLQKRAPNWH